MNLFQYTTSSNYPASVTAFTKSGNSITAVLLEELDVPWGGTDTTIQGGGMYGLMQKQYQFYPGKNATFIYESQSEDSLNSIERNILMPHPLYMDFDDDGKRLIAMLADTAPEVKVGETNCQVSKNAKGPLYWNFNMPVGAYGNLIVTENGLKSIPRIIHRWQPKVKIEYSFEGLNYTANLSLVALATLDYFGFRTYPWDDLPSPSFETDWEKDSSTVSWSVSGTNVQEAGSITYSGSGLRKFGDNDYGSLSMDQNGGSFYCGAYITGKETQTSVLGTYTYDWSDDAHFYADSIPVSFNWEFNGQTVTDPFVSSTATWSAFSPDPLFINELEPR